MAGNHCRVRLGECAGRYKYGVLNSGTYASCRGSGKRSVSGSQHYLPSFRAITVARKKWAITVVLRYGVVLDFNQIGRIEN